MCVGLRLKHATAVAGSLSLVLVILSENRPPVAAVFFGRLAQFGRASDFNLKVAGSNPAVPAKSPTVTVLLRLWRAWQVLPCVNTRTMFKTVAGRAYPGRRYSGVG